MNYNNNNNDYNSNSGDANQLIEYISSLQGSSSHNNSNFNCSDQNSNFNQWNLLNAYRLERENFQLNDQQTEVVQKIKRPMNAFMVWSQTRRAQIASTDSKIHNSQISKELGVEWRSMSSDQKAPYIQKAKDLRDELLRLHPDYVYRPKRRLRANLKILRPNANKNHSSPPGISPSLQRHHQQQVQQKPTSSPDYTNYHASKSQALITQMAMAKVACDRQSNVLLNAYQNRNATQTSPSPSPSPPLPAPSLLRTVFDQSQPMSTNFTPNLLTDSADIETISSNSDSTAFAPNDSASLQSTTGTLHQPVALLPFLPLFKNQSLISSFNPWIALNTQLNSTAATAQFNQPSDDQ